MYSKRRTSIRWRLPLSYAAIAFLAALALGIVLLFVLRSHYASVERQRLEGNAQALSFLVVDQLSQNKPIEVLSDQLRNFAFLWDTRIQLINPAGDILIDSGPPADVYVTFNAPPTVTFDVNMPGETALWTTQQDIMLPIEVISSDSFAPTKGTHMQIFAYPLGESEPAPRPDDVTDIRFVRMASSPFGLYGVAIGHPGQRIGSPRRSDQSAELTLYQPDQNAVLGTLRLNNGPAYGSEIVDSVAQTWLIASALAVMIAGAVGWFISQQLSNPLLSLTRATERMANGDLSVRTALKRRDELGLLSSAFDEMAGQIENTVVALRRFVADAAHELHTPLTALRTNLELSIERADRQALDRALEQLKRLELLADDLLDLSRIESDPAHMPRQPLEITPLVQQISEVYASRAEQADLDYVLELPDKAPIIAGNPAQIQRLIANLLDNAIKFTPAGGQIAVKIHQKGEQVELTVEDSGIGIPQEDLPYLFERFRRGRNTAQYPGSGLGLAIVRAIVCAHHGTVHAHSQGCGTKISVLLPTISPKAA